MGSGTAAIVPKDIQVSDAKKVILFDARNNLIVCKITNRLYPTDTLFNNMIYKISECRDDPPTCQNGGTCTDGFGNICDCPVGYTGLHCEQGNHIWLYK